MAKLMRCSICKKPVASTATECPHCGAKDEVLSGKSIEIKDWKVIAIVIIITIIVVKFTINNSFTDKENKQIIKQKKQIEQTKEYKQNAKSAIKILGIWSDEYGFVGTKLVLYNYEGKLFLDNVFETYSITTELTSEEVLNGIVLYDINGKHFGEYFLLTSQKNLQFWNKTRNYYTAKKLKLTEDEIQRVKQLLHESQSGLSKKREIKLKKENTIKNHKLKISINYHSLNGKIYFTGKTNLPQDTKIGIRLNDKASDFKIYIKHDGSYKSTGFSELDRPLHGKYKVELMLFRNQFWQTKKILKKLDDYYGYGLDYTDNKASVVKEFIF